MTILASKRRRRQRNKSNGGQPQNGHDLHSIVDQFFGAPTTISPADIFERVAGGESRESLAAALGVGEYVIERMLAHAKALNPLRGYSPQVVQVPIDEIIESDENWALYRKPNPDDPEFQSFTDSCRDGIREPLAVSADNYLTSGHRRLAAARVRGMTHVPVLYAPVLHSQCTGDEWLTMLREHNRQRPKNTVEQIRERMVDLNPEDVLRRVVEDKLVRAHPKMEIIDLGGRAAKRRNEISPRKRPYADRIKEILTSLKLYLPVSVRKVHYKLLEGTILRNQNRPKSLYVNNKTCAADTSDMLTRMRLSGEIPFDWIEDETRDEDVWGVWRNAAHYISEQAPKILSEYSRDLMQSQDIHFEIVVEKLTIRNFISPIAGRYTIPVNIIRGNSSIPPRYKISQRYKQSAKDSMMLICFGDCDPSGDNIVESTILSLRDEFGCEGIRGVRAGLTHDQADALGLPQKMDANQDDPNYPRFIRKHGRKDVYELDAVDISILQEWTDQTIRAVIDTGMYNAEVQAQAVDVSEIEATAAEMRGVLGPM